ncbi:prepilin peptidase [Saliterribacillus persicus]|uniref:Prepilin leader peptidase/N-methyltransferase n=1 Tax=Saliterribacillus persicus TaxID=930114 RepID=A0A368XIU7_9BACI|nr:A24 family peptidase [Saliterribacillus persicus]RCW66397.1 leader peptidase (prepilin peptidase)/N-methyltransferase [Saliterribacillus persicus]
METFLLFYFFILGLVLGSFLNVVGLRVPTKTLFKSSRSICPNCKHQLSYLELIPVFSYIFQRGKCKHCQQHISPIYPIIELSTGILFLFSFMRVGLTYELITAFLVVSLLMIVIVSDLNYMLIPNAILLFFLPLFIFVRIISPLEPWYDMILGAVLGYVLLALIIIISRGGMGAGDMKLIALLGIILGWQDVLLTFFLASLYGTVISIALLLTRKWDRKKMIPFGPFIALAALTIYFFGEEIVELYISYFL